MRNTFHSSLWHNTILRLDHLGIISTGYYVTKVRIQKMMELLVRTEESIEQIAETVGYATGFALSKAFKRISGVSPQHYRLQATG